MQSVRWIQPCRPLRMAPNRKTYYPLRTLLHVCSFCILVKPVQVLIHPLTSHSIPLKINAHYIPHFITLPPTLISHPAIILYRTLSPCSLSWLIQSIVGSLCPFEFVFFSSLGPSFVYWEILCLYWVSQLMVFLSQAVLGKERVELRFQYLFVLPAWQVALVTLFQFLSFSFEYLSNQVAEPFWVFLAFSSSSPIEAVINLPSFFFLLSFLVEQAPHHSHLAYLPHQEIIRLVCIDRCLAQHLVFCELKLIAKSF